MDYIRFRLKQIFRKKAEKKILYLHGLWSSSEREGISYIRTDYKIIYPVIKYSDEAFWQYIIALVEKRKPQAIIGNHLGGYIAYYISNKFELPALLLNPTLDGEGLITISEEVLGLHPYKDQTIINSNNISLPELYEYYQKFLSDFLK